MLDVSGQMYEAMSRLDIFTLSEEWIQRFSRLIQLSINSLDHCQIVHLNNNNNNRTGVQTF